MAVARQAAKVRNVTRSRWFLEGKAETDLFTQVVSATQSPYGLGSQFSQSTLTFSATELSDNAQAWIASHDRFRVSQIEVFANYNINNTAGGPALDQVELYFYEDTDVDPSVATSWLRTSDRENLGRVVLTAQNPSQRLITFKPTPTLNAGTLAQDPSNIVPSKDAWLDALSLAQKYAGLRVFGACSRRDTSGQTYQVFVSYLVRYQIEARQPI
jgi:hypothetical protein